MTATHGNSKTKCAPYKRTKPDVLDKAAQVLQTKKPRLVYKEMVTTDEANVPNKLQQIRNLKHPLK